MPYSQAKIYFDGSHYIAIPQTFNPYRRKKNTKINKQLTQTLTDKTENKKSATEALPPKERFERLYKESNGKKKTEKIKNITKEMEKEFKDKDEAKDFVLRNMERITRNKIVRKTRLVRKLYLNEWNWFCTVTYFYGYLYCRCE